MANAIELCSHTCFGIGRKWFKIRTPGVFRCAQAGVFAKDYQVKQGICPKAVAAMH